MNKFIKFLSVALMAGTFAAAPVHAADAPAAGKAPVIAVVDVQAPLKNSKAAQNIGTQVQSIRKEFPAEV